MKKTVSLFILTLILTFTTNAQSISSALHQAQEMFAAGNEAGAIESLTSILQKNPDNQAAKTLLENYKATMRERQVEADWQTAQETNTFESYEHFRGKHPDSKYDYAASDNMAKRLADKFTPNSSYSDKMKAESYAKRGMTKDYVANKWKAAMAKKSTNDAISSSSTSTSLYSQSSSYDSLQSSSIGQTGGQGSSKAKSDDKPKAFSWGINGNLEGLTSFSTGIGLNMRLGRISSRINLISGVKYQHTYCKELVSYLDVNNNEIKSGMAYYKQNISQIIVPMILNWNFTATNQICGFLGFGYEYGFLLSKKDCYKNTYGDFNLNDYLASEDYPDHTLLAYPARNLVIKLGMGACHWDWSLYCKYFLNKTEKNESASLGFEFTYYF